MYEPIKRELEKDIWIRVLFAVFFFFIAFIVRMLIIITAVLQIASNFIWKTPNNNLTNFGNLISVYFYEVMQFITYSSDKKPFPFSPWPHV